MFQLLVVDEIDDRRAGTVDALCELPGVEVCARASDAASALAILDDTHADAIVATSDMIGASIVTLIEGARRRGLGDVIVAIADRLVLPGMTEYLRDIGARACVDTLPQLVAQVQELAAQHRRRTDRRAQIAQRIENATFAARPTSVAQAGSLVVSTDPRPPRAAPLLDVGDALRDLLPRLRRLVHDEVELVLEVVGDLPRVRCTATDIERILLHLVHDATTAIPLGGKVWVIAERESHRNVRIEVLDSSGKSRIPGTSIDSARVIVDRYAGLLRVVDLGSATSLQVVLPAIVDAAN